MVSHPKRLSGKSASNGYYRRHQQSWLHVVSLIHNIVGLRLSAFVWVVVGTYQVTLPCMQTPSFYPIVCFTGPVGRSRAGQEIPKTDCPFESGSQWSLSAVQPRCGCIIICLSHNGLRDGYYICEDGTGSRGTPLRVRSGLGSMATRCCHIVAMDKAHVSPFQYMSSTAG